MKKEKQGGYKVERQTVLSFGHSSFLVADVVTFGGVPGVVVDSSILYSTLFSSLHFFYLSTLFCNIIFLLHLFLLFKFCLYSSLVIFKDEAFYCLDSLYCKFLQNLYITARMFVFSRFENGGSKRECFANVAKISMIGPFFDSFSAEIARILCC
jgi:hypothetical protein